MHFQSLSYPIHLMMCLYHTQATDFCFNCILELKFFILTVYHNNSIITFDKNQKISSNHASYHYLAAGICVFRRCGKP